MKLEQIKNEMIGMSHMSCLKIYVMLKDKYVPLGKGEVGDIAFGADPVGLLRCSFLSALYLDSEPMSGFWPNLHDQTRYILLRQGK